jgi:ankyrin repeat protein
VESFDLLGSEAPPSAEPPPPRPTDPPAAPAPGAPPATLKFWATPPHLKDLFAPAGQPAPVPDDRKVTHNDLNEVIQKCFEAIENGNYSYIRTILRTTKEEQLRRILSAKTDILHHEGQTLLHYVCDQSTDKRLEILPFLLQKIDANGINAPDDNQRTPLHRAAACNRVWACELLLSRGADVNAVDKDQITPLHLAALNGRAACVACLLEHGAKIDAVDKDQLTPLHRAAFNGHADCVACLLAHGANIDAVDKDQQTPLHWAASNGRADCVACLLAHGAKIDAVDKYQSTPLHRAASNGRAACVACLLAHGAKIDAVDKYQKTPFHLAAFGGHADCVACLLAHGANIDAVDKDQSTPLHLAALTEQAACVACLLAHGAKIDAVDKDQQTPLHRATTANWDKKFPIAVAEVLLSWLRGQGKSGNDILTMLRSKEFLRGHHFKLWRDNLRAETAKAGEIRELLKDYGVDVGQLLADPSSQTATE